jgi:hypothetical protein
LFRLDWLLVDDLDHEPITSHQPTYSSGWPEALAI